MDGQEAFRRLARQIRNVGGGSPGGPPKGIFAGSGLLIALVAGGFALNASLFNGMSSSFGSAQQGSNSL
jgi:prohibitin 2